MTYPLDMIRDAHRHSSGHRAELEQSRLCGCFYCCRTFLASEIEDWIADAGETAHCPHCWIDSVIGSASGFPVHEPEFLRDARPSVLAA